MIIFQKFLFSKFEEANKNAQILIHNNLPEKDKDICSNCCSPEDIMSALHIARKEISNDVE